MPHSLFFYGTLVHPAILARVIGNDGSHLTTSDALLPGYTRHHVKGEDYPAVVDVDAGSKIIGRELSETESRVQGSCVQGLTDEEIGALDVFEGDEYARRTVTVQVESGSISAQVYVWISDDSRLSPSLWTFEDFLRESAHRWVGANSENQPDYVEVDRRRAMNGFITPTGVQQVSDKVKNELNLDDKKGLLPLGQAIREKYWDFEDGWTNLNHGSYGSTPRPVLETAQGIRRRSDLAPDRFMRYEYIPQMQEARRQIGELIGCDTDDVVFVTNATSGVNAILRSLTSLWERGDKMLYFSTTIYNACDASLRYVIDTHPHLALTLVPVPLAYPLPHAEVIARTRKAIEDAKKGGGGKIRLALIDALSSNPGVVVPWQDLVKLLREHDILSLVDAAHEIGQMSVNLRDSKPDFWVSNCHKWLHTPRSCAVLYVSKAYQHRMHSIPIGHYYRHRPDLAPEGVPDWVLEFEWNGTIDFSPCLSVPAALDFRRDVLGGEERIMTYCHQLAVEAGEHVAQVLGTETMRNRDPNDGELVANMVNVRLPIKIPPVGAPDHAEKVKAISTYWGQQQIDNKTFVPLFLHDGKPWIRLSAQVYNDMEQYRWWAQVARQVCANIEAGEHEKKR